LDYGTPNASTIEESNALALAIVPSESGNQPCSFSLFYSLCEVLLCFLVGCLYMFIRTPNSTDVAPTFNSVAGQAKDFDPTGWELALVTTPSSNISATNERQLVGCLPFLFSFPQTYIFYVFSWSVLFVD
jgi:hypothetical protein